MKEKLAEFAGIKLSQVADFLLQHPTEALSLLYAIFSLIPVLYIYERLVEALELKDRSSKVVLIAFLLIIYNLVYHLIIVLLPSVKLVRFSPSLMSVLSFFISLASDLFIPVLVIILFAGALLSHIFTLFGNHKKAEKFLKDFFKIAFVILIAVILVVLYDLALFSALLFRVFKLTHRPKAALYGLLMVSLILLSTGTPFLSSLIAGMIHRLAKLAPEEIKRALRKIKKSLMMLMKRIIISYFFSRRIYVTFSMLLVALGLLIGYSLKYEEEKCLMKDIKVEQKDGICVIYPTDLVLRINGKELLYPFSQPINVSTSCNETKIEAFTTIGTWQKCEIT